MYLLQPMGALTASKQNQDGGFFYNWCIFFFHLKTVNSVSESLEESAAAYTKATAKKCILEKVDVKTGEESESNVLQVIKHPIIY